MFRCTSENDPCNVLEIVSGTESGTACIRTKISFGIVNLLFNNNVTVCIFAICAVYRFRRICIGCDYMLNLDKYRGSSIKNVVSSLNLFHSLLSPFFDWLCIEFSEKLKQIQT